MDPATILGIAGTASQVAESIVRTVSALYSFIEAARRTDRTLEAFAQEIVALKSACGFVNRRLESIVKHADEEEAGNPKALGRVDQIWPCLQTQLDACQRTVADLGHVLGVDAPIQSDMSMVDRFRKQADLRAKSNEIKEHRERVKSHTTGLQLMLTCISVDISYLAPWSLNQEFVTDMQELKSERAEFAELLPRIREHLKGPDAAVGDALLKVSGDVVSSGETLHESVHGSVLATQPTTMLRVSGWIRDLHIIGSGAYDDSTPTSAERSSIFFTPYEDPISPQSTASQDYTSTITESTADDGNDSDDSDDDKIDLANASILHARRKFEQKKWSAAKAKFEDVLKQIVDLRIRQRRSCQIGEIPYLIAICTWHLSEPAEARQELEAVIQDATRSGMTKEDFHGPRLCQLKIMLAQSCVRMGELERAHEHVENARSSIRKNKKLLGKDHESFYESLALSARIFELQGNMERCETIREQMIIDQFAGCRHLFSDLEIDRKSVASRPAFEPRDSVIEAQPSSASLNQEGVSPHSSPTLRQTATMTTMSLDKEVVGLESSKPVRQSTTTSILSGTTLSSEEASIRVKSISSLAPIVPDEYVFQSSHLKALAASQPPRAISKMTAVERWAALKDLKPETKVAVALVEGKDEAAKELVRPRGGKGRFLPNGKKALDLHFAAMFGVTEVVDALLYNGADIEHVEKNKRPLDRAVEGGHLDTVQLLLTRGCKHGRIGNRPSVLTLAAVAERYDIVDALLAGGADPTAEEHEAGSALLWACAQDNMSLVDAFRPQHFPSLSELRPVHCWVARHFYHAETNVLIVTKQSPGVFLMRTKFWLDAYGTAAQSGALTVLKALADARVDTGRTYSVDISGSKRDKDICASTLAAAYGHEEVVAWMIHSGHMHDCKTAWHAAVLNKHFIISDMIKAWHRQNGK